ncbi:MAG: crosslink repair DNA glycosylase YcaQ family protein [Pseudomonadota bacterium]
MIDARKLRRIALNQQGLIKRGSFGRGKAATLRAIEKIGYVQIDTISVVARAHHHVLHTRVPNYREKFLDDLVEQKKVFEYWSHAAAYLPMRDYRFALPRMQAIRNGEEKHWTQNSKPKLKKDILRRIRDEGPLQSRDFEDTRRGKKEWWDWKPAKHALEELFMTGELMALGRDGFQKIYDLPERVLPDDVDTRAPTISEYAAYLINSTLNAHGFATQKSFSYLRKGKNLRSAIETHLAASLDARELAADKLKSGATVYFRPESLDKRASRASAQALILSPFDNLVIQRERGRDIFDFDYQIECYVPETKRQYGYFCLPILYRDTLVGRMDCKAHRKECVYEVRQLHIEKDVDDAFPLVFANAVCDFASFNGCVDIKLKNGVPVEISNSIQTVLSER